MALASLGEWNRAPDYLGAIRAGASTGLSLRKQDTEERETADRLRLAYDQLASRERQAAENTKRQLELHKQTLNEQSRQHDMLMDWHRGQLQEQRRRTDLMANKPDKPIAPKIHFGTRGEVIQAMPDGTVKVLREGTPEVKYHGPHVKLPADANGVEISGPADSPEIKAVLKRFDDAAAARAAAAKAAAQQPSWWQKLFSASAPGAIPKSPAIETSNDETESVPLPKIKSDMVKGQRYSVRGKDWEWDGEKLVSTE